MLPTAATRGCACPKSLHNSETDTVLLFWLFWQETQKINLSKILTFSAFKQTTMVVT